MNLTPLTTEEIAEGIDFELIEGMTPEEEAEYLRGFAEQWARQNRKSQREVFLDALVMAGFMHQYGIYADGWVSRDEIEARTDSTGNSMRSLISSFYRKKYNLKKTRLYRGDKDCTLYRIIPTPVQFQLTDQRFVEPAPQLNDEDRELIRYLG